MNRMQTGTGCTGKGKEAAFMLGPESRRFRRKRELDILGKVVLKGEEAPA